MRILRTIETFSPTAVLLGKLFKPPIRGRSVKCFRCGKRDAVIDGLCRECYLETHHLLKVPEYMDMQVCLHCGAVSRDGRKWQDGESTAELIKDLALSGVRSGMVRGARLLDTEATLRERDPYTYELHGTISLAIGPFTAEEEFESTIRLKGATCPACSRLNGNYYEAIIQVRATGRDMSEDEKRRAREFIWRRVGDAAEGNRNIFLAKERDVHGGIDFYISHAGTAKSSARELSTEFDGEMTESRKLSGRRNGEDFYRFTYLVRVPEFGKGDFVRYKGRYFTIASSSGKGWKLRSLEGGMDVKIRKNDSKDLRFAGRKEDAREAIVLSHGEGEVQVMDPFTYRTVSLRYRGRKKKTVKVIRIDGEIYALPDDEHLDDVPTA